MDIGVLTELHNTVNPCAGSCTMYSTISEIYHNCAIAYRLSSVELWPTYSIQFIAAIQYSTVHYV